MTRKVTPRIAQILSGQADKIYLGNLESLRDWGYAPEYVDAMWRMLQQDQPDDYVIATGETRSVQELVEVAFGYVGLNWNDYVGIDQRYFRPTEVDALLGDASKAKQMLGWTPTTTFRELVRIMLACDLREAGIDLSLYPEIENVPSNILEAQHVQAETRKRS